MIYRPALSKGVDRGCCGAGGQVLEFPPYCDHVMLGGSPDAGTRWGGMPAKTAGTDTTATAANSFITTETTTTTVHRQILHQLPPLLLSAPPLSSRSPGAVTVAA